MLHMEDTVQNTKYYCICYYERAQIYIVHYKTLVGQIKLLWASTVEVINGKHWQLVRSRPDNDTDVDSPLGTAPHGAALMIIMITSKLKEIWLFPVISLVLFLVLSLKTLFGLAGIPVNLVAQQAYTRKALLTNQSISIYCHKT